MFDRVIYPQHDNGRVLQLNVFTSIVAHEGPGPAVHTSMIIPVEHKELGCKYQKPATYP